jgi:hypothetical protein
VLELLGRGHQVTALSDPDAEWTFRGLGCDFTPERRAAAVLPPARPVTREGKSRWWQDYALAVFADTTSALQGGSYDVVLADPLEPGLDFAAESRGVPYASYVHWGLDECGPDVPFVFHLWDHETPVDVAFAAWWNDLRARTGLAAEPRPAAGHRWYRTSPTLTLLLGLPDLVYSRGVLPPNTFRIGPTVWDPPVTAALPDWVARVGAEKPAVLASVSTIGSAEDLATVDLLASATEALAVDLIVTIPIDHQLGPLGNHVQIGSFVPHSKLLPKVSAFVNHAGNGSVNRAACAGKPVLLMPTGRDQFQVARGASAAGFALTLQPDERDLDHIQGALNRLLREQEFATAARRLAAKANGYRAPVEAVDHIEALVANGGDPE